LKGLLHEQSYSGRLRHAGGIDRRRGRRDCHRAQEARLPEAINFVRSNQEALRRVRVALFTVHVLNRANDEQSRLNREAYLDALRPLVRPVDHVFFAGKIDPARLSLIERLMVRAVKSPGGDFRDWDKIDVWAQNVLAQEISR
jgi:menaquinone-dependent protoporphyrinogen oxidase